jgi:hypothetical protein
MTRRASTLDPERTRLLNETLARCRVVVLERRELWCTRERSDWVGACIRPLHSTSPSREERSALRALAFGGWWWREAEQGDRARVRSAIAAAYLEAQADPEVPDQIVPAWAAWRFLDRGGDCSEGSPGATHASRVGFLGAACRRFHETYGDPARLSQSSGDEAFYRGVALNDVERLALQRPPFLDGTRS